MIKSILKNPDEPKYRMVKIKNAQRILSLKPEIGLNELLEAIDFHFHKGENLIFKGENFDFLR